MVCCPSCGGGNRMSSPVTASILFPMDEFRGFIACQDFRKPKQGRAFGPSQCVRISFPAAGVMLATREYLSGHRRIVKKTNLVLVGKRLRFRRTETKYTIWKCEEAVDQEIACLVAGVPPSPIVLPGYQLKSCFK